VSLKIKLSMGMVSWLSLITSLRANGNKDKKSLEFRPKKEDFMKVNLYKIKKRVLEFHIGTMDMMSILESGKMDWKAEMECGKTLMETSISDSGLKEKFKGLVSIQQGTGKNIRATLSTS